MNNVTSFLDPTRLLESISNSDTLPPFLEDTLPVVLISTEFLVVLPVLQNLAIIAEKSSVACFEKGEDDYAAGNYKALVVDSAKCLSLGFTSIALNIASLAIPIISTMQLIKNSSTEEHHLSEETTFCMTKACWKEKFFNKPQQ